jgi:phage shock protein PspC (stress-responsive transcriptional regulator)
MTSPDPDPEPTPARRLTRTSDDRMLAGVAAGLGRHFDLDPALVRIAFVVLALFGGSGVAIYVILWLLLPSDTRPARIRGDSPTSHKVALGVVIVAAIISVPFTGPAFLFAGPALLVVAVLGALGVLLWRAVGGEGSPTLTRVALGILALTGAAILGLGAGVAAAFGGGTIVAGLVIATGVALIVGGFLGGARWLIVPAVVMMIPLAVVSAADLDLTGGVGQRDYRPSSMDDLRSSYRLGAGELRLDLRGVDLPAGTTALKVHVGAGRIEVTVPRTVCVQSKVHVGAGQVVRFDAEDEGIDVRLEHRPRPRSDAPVLFVDADAGMGQVQFDHELSANHWREGADSFDDGRQAACES